MTPTHTAASDWPDWLQLVTTPGVSARQLRQLLSAYGGPAQVLAASEADRAHWVGAAAAAALNRPPQMPRCAAPAPRTGWPTPRRAAPT